jgi:predicted RNA-binding protein YlxR (DUF448 family)
LAIRGHVPIRTCVVCGNKRARSELLRLALEPEAEVIVLDTLRRMRGRGAYVCSSCLPGVSLTGRIRKAFRNRAKGLSADSFT